LLNLKTKQYDKKNLTTKRKVIAFKEKELVDRYIDEWLDGWIDR